MITTFPGSSVVFHVYFADANGYARDLSGTEYFRWRVMENEAGSYTQVLPPAGWTLGDLLLDREGVGEYRVTVPIDPLWTVGQYLFEVEAVGVRSYYWSERFEVVAAELPGLRLGSHLALIRDAREYGIAPAVPDYRIAAALVRASAAVERYCGRSFTPRKQTMKLFCELRGVLWFPTTCSWLQGITTETGEAVSLTGTQLYSRTMRTDMGNPGIEEDDRDASRIAGGVFSPSRAYFVTGVFGYTEPQGSDIGATPVQITWATVATALNYLSFISSGPAPVPVDRIIEEKTATQSYKLSENPDWASEVTAGDTEIARVLNGFRRPMQIGVV